VEHHPGTTIQSRLPALPANARKAWQGQTLASLSGLSVKKLKNLEKRLNFLNAMLFSSLMMVGESKLECLSFQSIEKVLTSATYYWRLTGRFVGQKIVLKLKP